MSETKKGQLKRGVSLYSYSDLFGYCMTLEDCFQDIYDMGATCVEILASHVENYPNPSTQWVDNWFKLCEKYKIEPAEYGHWFDTRLYEERELNVDEAVENIVRDFKLANLLGFKVLRTKLTTLNENCDPVPGWEKYVEKALPYAEKYDVRMCSEIHRPTAITTKHVQDYLEFIHKTGTKHFGFNVDFGTFQNAFPAYAERNDKGLDYPKPKAASKPADILLVLPYTYCCHAKFNLMDEAFDEVTIPYKEVLHIMVDNDWKGFLVSEYEGRRKDEPDFLYDQLRRQHIMIKRIIGY